MFARRIGSIKWFLGVACVCMLVSVAQSAEVVLRAQTALPRQHEQVSPFLKYFIDQVNKVGVGVVRIDYLGGPEVTPANRAAQALQRGVLDIYWTPAGYLAGLAPAIRAMILRKVSVSTLRENGGFQLFAQDLEERLNAHLLAWGEAAGGYCFYTVEKPKQNKEGVIDLTGLRMRDTPTYRPFLKALNGTPVQISSAEVFTALERGIVDGFGWPTIGLKSMGLTSAVKYRIDPPFYSLADVVLVNEDKWKALPQGAKNILNKVAIEYEEASSAAIRKSVAQDVAANKKAGVKVIRNKGSAGSKYLSNAYGSMWNVISEQIGAKRARVLEEKLSGTH